MKTQALLVFLCALVVAGCTGMIYPEGDQFIIQAIGLEGTTQNDCSVFVEEQADQDGLEDAAWSADFRLDGQDEINSLPADMGTEVTHTLWVQATQTADGQVYHKKVVITLYE